MKVGILTLPLHTNLGGILQNYALQESLRRLGHNPTTINLKQKDTTRMTMFLSLLKRLILKVILRKSDIILRVWPTANEKHFIYGGINTFINSNISLTKPVSRIEDLNEKEKSNFEAYIVGSDQVWRPKYVKNIAAYFLDFLNDDSKSIKIAYAASLGVDHWEYTAEQTEHCKKLIQKFDAISVREESAISLIRLQFGIEAIQLLDPVFLLAKEDYESLILPIINQAKAGGIFAYILDRTDDRLNIAKKISKELDLDIYSILPTKRFEEVGPNEIESCIHPSISDWIQSFKYADFIVTDSFHGIVLSIIFNKEFICIGNSNRGLTRMTSILKKFNLMDRLILDGDQSIELLKLEKIDFSRVNSLIELEKNIAIDFLRTSLSH